MTADETLNELLVCLFKDLTEIEGRCLITDEFSDISINDMHIIEAIGVDEPKRSGTVAKLMSITLGTLTKAIDGLTRKGYVNRIRSEEDKRVVKLSLTDKGKSAYYHHEQFHRHMIEHIKDGLSDDEMKVLITGNILQRKKAQSPYFSTHLSASSKSFLDTKRYFPYFSKNFLPPKYPR